MNINQTLFVLGFVVVIFTTMYNLYSLMEMIQYIGKKSKNKTSDNKIDMKVTILSLIIFLIANFVTFNTFMLEATKTIMMQLSTLGNALLGLNIIMFAAMILINLADVSIERNKAIGPYMANQRR